MTTINDVTRWDSGKTVLVSLKLGFAGLLIEDEIHFLFYSSKYSIMRDNVFNKIQTLIPNIRHLPVNDLIVIY